MENSKNYFRRDSVLEEQIPVEVEVISDKKDENSKKEVSKEIEIEVVPENYY